MKWIGINKNDPSQRKFEFDDSQVLTSDPPQYSVRFLDTNEQSSVVCGDVFRLKPVEPFKKRPNLNVIEPKPLEESQNNIPNEEEIQADIAMELTPIWNKKKSQPNTVTTTPTPTTVQQEKSKRPVGRPRKNKVETVEQNGDFPITHISIPQEHKYEYKTILVELENVTYLQEKLNELGDKRWELVNFQVIQSLLPNKSRLFCILKRNKQ